MRSTLSRAGSRRGSGEASATGGQLVDLETAIALLEKREIQELRTEWRKLYRADRRADPRQDRRLEEEGHVDGRHAAARISGSRP